MTPSRLLLAYRSVLLAAVVGTLACAALLVADMRRQAQCITVYVEQPGPVLVPERVCPPAAIGRRNVLRQHGSPT